MPSHSKIDYFLLRCTKIVIYLIPILPLYISSSLMFPFITGKNFAFRILVEFAAALWLCLLVTNKDCRLKNSLMTTTILIFTFIIGLADLFGMNAYISFWSNYERMEGYITILHLALFFMIISSIFKTRNEWITFFSIYVVVSVFVSLFAIIEPIMQIQPENYIAEYGARRSSTIGNPPFLSTYLLLSIILALILYLMTRKTYLKLFCVFSIILNSVIIFIVASRGVMLAFFIGALIIGTFMFLRYLKRSAEIRMRKVVLLILCLLIIAFIIFNLPISDLMKDNTTINRFMTTSLDDPSVASRLYAWKIAWNGIKEHPLLGWGQENFIGVYTVSPIPLMGKLIWLDRAHNIIIDWLISAGFLGLFSYLAIYGVIFYILWNNLRRKIISINETIIVATSFVVYFIQNLFTFDNLSSYLVFFALIAYIDNIETMICTPYVHLKGNFNLKKHGSYSVIVTLSSLIVFSLTFYFLNYIQIKQLRLYTHISTSLSKYQSYSQMLDDFNEALSYGSFGDNYIREEMAGVSRQIIEYQLYKQEGALKLIQTTAEEMEKGIEVEPQNLEYIFKVYGFYEFLASYDPLFIPKAEALLEKCLSINPKFTRINMNKIDLYFLKKDYESAYIKLKKFADKYPKLLGWKFRLVLAAILTSREDEMQEAVENLKDLRMTHNADIASGIKPVFSIKGLNMLVQAHMEVKNYKHALKYYREILFNLSNYKDIRLKSNDLRPLNNEEKMQLKSKVHLEISKIYIILGEKENTEKEANKAAELDPANFRTGQSNL